MKSRVPVLCALLSAAATAHAQGPAVTKPAVSIELDRWSKPITWRTPTGDYATSIHATLLPDGRVLHTGYWRESAEPIDVEDYGPYTFLAAPDPLGAPLPDEVVVAGEPVPVDFDNDLAFPLVIGDDIFCAGHTLTSDGTFFSAGGTRTTLNTVTAEYNQYGLPYAVLFDGTSWTRPSEDMKVAGVLGGAARWYPTCTRLADGRILVTAGFDEVWPTPSANLSAEVFDPATETWEVVSDFGATPAEIENPDYPHVFLLPEPVEGYELLMFGDDGVPVLFEPGGATPWAVRPEARPGTPPFVQPNVGASSTLLPFRVADGEWGYRNGSVLMAGGDHGSQAQHSADVYDPVVGAWLPTVDLQIRRHHPSTVLLPDGRVLLLSGHDESTGDPGVTRAQYVDPRAGFAVSWGRARETVIRGYHSVALLLPDGRVLVGGGRDQVTGESLEKVTFRYYSPPYMAAERPSLDAAPAGVGYGTPFDVTTSGAAPAEACLLALGSMTHSVDMNQRYVQLELASVSGPLAGSYTASLVGPAGPSVAPPGHYLLFVLDGERIPSEARVVLVQ
ncbi:MAG: galactose oxidase early set domain-containing protein [Planctomycetota bacterium]